MAKMPKAGHGVRVLGTPVVPGSGPKPAAMDCPSEGNFPMVHGGHPAGCKSGPGMRCDKGADGDGDRRPRRRKRRA